MSETQRAYTDRTLIWRAPYHRGSLWQGAKPPKGVDLKAAGFDLIVFCAEEYQPSTAEVLKHHGKIPYVACGIDDGYGPTEEEALLVEVASDAAAKAFREGANVLITCQMGINRSGLVMARTIHKALGWDGNKAIQHIRSRRDPSLHNHHFRRYIRETSIGISKSA